ncbi:MAG: hypothetical protein K6D96_11445 [Acetatifactor sp.]|nr:hypothetical protein [Acetatifactor sp.]
MIIKTIKTFNKEKFEEHLDAYKRINSVSITGFSKTVFSLEDGSILCIPREDGDERYPYGEGGYNFWAYTSGYMHANDGLFSPFLRANAGEDPKIAFFAGDDITGRVISLLRVPSLTEGAERFCVFSADKAYYYSLSCGVTYCVTVEVSDSVTNDMLFSIYIFNNTDEVRDIFLSSYFNPYLRNSICESSEDKWFRSSRVEENAFVFSINEDLSRTVSVTNFGVVNRRLLLSPDSIFKDEKLTTSSSLYKGGQNYGLSNAENVLKHGFTEQKVTAFTENAIAGDRVSMRLAPHGAAVLQEELRYSKANAGEDDYKVLLGFSGSATEYGYAREHGSAQSRDKGYDTVMTFDSSSLPKLESRVMTDFAECLSKQVEFCAQIKGYVQLSTNSLIGIRDVFQALEGYIYLNPVKAREKMLEAFGFIDPSGRCPRQYSLPANNGEMPHMDLREFIDQGCWVIDCVTSYLKLTGDFAFLNEKCGYCRIVDESSRMVEMIDSDDTVLDHMLRIMEYLCKNIDSDTNCVRALYGDWNDALDGLGVSSDPAQKFGNGVSVMASLQVYKNLTDMIELLKNLNSGNVDIVSGYRETVEKLKQGILKNAVVTGDDGERRILHGWGQDRSYFVGSFKDSDGLSRHGLTSNAFWILSGLIEDDKSLFADILKAYEALDSKYGYKTFDPAFGRNVKGVGRIYKLPVGTAENGASYIHATTFAIMSLFMMGEGRKAWEQIIKILPFTHEKVSCSPFVMPNSYGFNMDLNIDGESMQDWQTGSSNVLLKTLIRFVLGFNPDYDKLVISPAAYCPFDNFEFGAVYRGRHISVRYEKSHGPHRTFTLNGTVINGEYDENLKTEKLVLGLCELKYENHIVIT